jgi:hypothetical protein
MYLVELITFIDEANGTSYRARFDTEVSSQGMTVVAHTPLGVPLFVLKVEDGQMRLHSYADQIEDPAIEQFLMDIVLSYWPLDQLQAATRDTDYRVSQNLNVREYRGANDTLIVKIQLSAESGQMRTTKEVIHYDVPLKLLIDTLHLELDPY